MEKSLKAARNCSLCNKSKTSFFLLLFQFTHLPAHSWHKMPLMKSLDISWNPIRVLTKESFYGLVRLQLLRVQHLPDLKRFDGDSLAHVSYLTKLYIQSWPSIEKYKFRLGSVVSGIASLRTLSAIINEPNGLLTDQILGKVRFRHFLAFHSRQILV